MRGRMCYSPGMRFFFVCLFVLLSANFSQAVYETKDERTYGNCHVDTQVDLLTDEEGPSLNCNNNEDGRKYRSIFIGLNLKTRELTIGLYAGRQFIPSGPVDIALRVYPGPTIRRQTSSHGSGRAFIHDHELASSLLHLLAAGEKVIIQVDLQRGVIPLRGSAPAVRDFQERMATGSSVLTLPNNQ